MAQIEKHFDEELREFKDRLLTMGSHAESAVSHALEALRLRDDDAARRVEEDDDVIDRYEVEIDEMAVRLLTKAPLASDLRLVLVGMKISQNLERIGDEATTITRQTLELNREPALAAPIDIQRMARIALQMLKEALDSFVGKQSEEARLLIPRDKEVDALHRQYRRVLSEQMAAQPQRINGCLHWMVISKCVERVADHATNIAEEVVYLCEARDIRHEADPVASESRG